MKKLAKIMAVFAAIMMALAFAGCNNDDDDDPSTVAVYKATEEYDGVTVTELVTCYDDNTFVITAEANGEKVTLMTGTYTGDPTKDGALTISLTKMADDDGKLVDADADTKKYADGEYVIKDRKVEVIGTIYTRQ
ncbi:hypothetical protein [uncultured Treponema sp.]|uniref:hypothetical protein n=1 Tax=uncultured Treponema sp. TaxID=162155 RepID=UPI00259894D7|nr:hypothetical protein [uncultured Treponema sp.]